MGTAASAVQEWIDARQTAEAIEYGIRSIEISRNAYGASATHSRQIIAGCQAATRVLGRIVAQDYGTLRALKEARKQQRETVKALKGEIGTARQIKLALAA